MQGRLPAPPRRPKNRAEGIFFDRAVEKGLVASKRGWPDFVVWDQGGNLVGIVEVKPHRGRRLKREQVAVMRALASLGVPCYRWSPSEGYTRIITENGYSLSIHGVLE